MLRVHRARMLKWNYLHRIDYFLVGKGGTRTLEHTEVVEDAGWGFRRDGMTRDEWRVHYTRVCAEDFLDRVHGATGEWVVIVYQDRGTDNRPLVCSIRMRYRGSNR